jgi:hypothetical protein
VRWAVFLAVSTGLGSAFNGARSAEQFFAAEWDALFAWIDVLLALLFGASALLAGILRIDDWLVALPFGPGNNEIDVSRIRRVKPLPLPGLDNLLENWLEPVMARYDHGSTLSALFAAQNCTALDDEERVSGLLAQLAELEIIEKGPPATHAR